MTNDLGCRTHSFPVVTLTLAVGFNALVLCGLAYLLHTSAELLQASQQRYLRLVYLQGEIVHLDEVLTMSTRMAAASGDAHWELRYREFEPQLAAAISEAEMLAPPAGGRAATVTDAANQALVSMEHQAFEFVRGGNGAAAEVILNSAEYAKQKRVYTTGLDAYMADVVSELASVISAQRQRNRTSRIAAVLGALFLLTGWLAVIRRIDSWRARLERSELETTEANTALLHATRALTDANTTLEERVESRTTEVEQSHARIRNLSEQMLQSENKERERLALILHDDLQQLLVSAQLRLGACVPSDPLTQTDIQASMRAVKKAIAVSRSLSSELSSDALAEANLGKALESMSDQMTRQYHIPIQITATSGANELSNSVTRFVLRAARELLFNVIKHARASSVELEFIQTETQVTLRIQDDGIGIMEADSNTPSMTGLGLPAIRQRIGWLGGQFKLHGQPGNGTTAILTIPTG